MVSFDEPVLSFPAGENDEYRREYARAGLVSDVVRFFYQVREASGLSYADLAERLGCTAEEVESLEDFDSVPTLEDLAALSQATGIPVHLGAPGVADIDLGADRGPRSG